MDDTREESQQSQDSVMTLMEENRHEILYFAYGSNLSTRQMCHRCPSSTPIGLGYLEDWHWQINSRGYANIVQVPDDAPITDKPGDNGVYGLLYLLPPADEELLDGYEGVPASYEKVYLPVRWEKDDYGKPVGEMQQVLVYVDTKRTEVGLPWEEYVGRLEKGIDEMVDNWGMDQAYADFMRESLKKGVLK